MCTHLRVLSKSYLMNTNMTGFRWFSKMFPSLCFGRKYPVALGGLMAPDRGIHLLLHFKKCLEPIQPNLLLYENFNPSNGEAILSSKIQGCKDFWKPLKPCHVGTHWKISCWVLSDEYPCSRVSVIFQVFCNGQISHQQHKDLKVNPCTHTNKHRIQYKSIQEYRIKHRWPQLSA